MEFSKIPGQTVLGIFMKTLARLALAAACLAPAAFAGPPSEALKAKLEERYGKYATGVWEGSKMFGLIAKDDSGKVISSRYSDSAKPEFFIAPGSVPSGKIKLTIDTASGCEKPQCECAVGVYYPGPRQ